jgi:hypothetical protein
VGTDHRFLDDPECRQILDLIEKCQFEAAVPGIVVLCRVRWGANNGRIGCMF